jgi:type IV secretion system protein VirB9
MKTCGAAFLLAALLSCTTVDVERRVTPDTGGGTNAAGREESRVEVAFIERPPDIVVVEKPVYVPAGTPVSQTPSGRAAVEQANAAGILAPQDYSRAAMVYDYDADWVYEVYAQPLRATDICLQPGEQIIETPFVSDSERWLLGAGVSRENGSEIQHVYVKPKAQGQEASLIINTDRRVYHLIVKSFRDIHMPVVRWRYPGPDMPNTSIGPRRDSRTSPTAPGGEAEAQVPGPDPRFLSFNYRITYGWFKKPRWLPSLVYDDGRKTYITFPPDISQGELPAVFENRGDIVNYRVAGNVVIIDKLIEELTVKKEGREIVIAKKRR